MAANHNGQHDEGHQLLADLLDTSVEEVEQLGARLRARLNADMPSETDSTE